MKQAEFVNHPYEMWGGVECTVVRINNKVHDQLKMNGHEDRINDLDLFASIGIKKIRYPLLWEKYSSQKELFFTMHDKRLLRLQDLGITPIAGLLHHGSGPFETDLSQPQFPELLANYASTIAKKYPWIEYYTPVNEPLTTARFSGLYGIWYPHGKDDLSFAKIFLNEIKAIILSMSKIREVNPNAKLIQTEDMAQIHSTGLLKYQAELENQRRWLTYDILTGKFNEEHPFWEYFANIGIEEESLEFFKHNNCPPYICGFNYYVTSERFIDHRIECYPNVTPGGNDFQDYIDIECVRVGTSELTGVESLLKEAYYRYNLPIALTEVHLACSREEQLRWFNQAHETALRLIHDGIDFKAITAWSLLGSFDWNTLLQTNGEYYESGVFDVRSGKPRPTALAHLIKDLSVLKPPDNLLLQIPGWWKRDIRIQYLAPDDLKQKIQDELKQFKHVQPVLVLGNGSLAVACMNMCLMRGIPSVMTNKSSFEVYNENTILELITQHNPWAIINATGFTHIDEAELSPLDCFRENTLFPKMLSRLCLHKNIRMITFSTDQVFNGKKKQPYIESDLTDPLNVYGMSKKIAEEDILAYNPEVLVIRSSLLMNPWNSQDFLLNVLFKNENHQNIYTYSDIIISPSYLPDLINTALDLLIDRERGIWHLSSNNAISYYEFAKLAIGMAGLSDKSIQSIPAIRLKNKAIRPSYSVLKSSSGIVLLPLESAIAQYLKELEISNKA